MGLDSVEMVMEVEDEFDIRIPDDAAERMETIGDVARYVTRVLRQTQPTSHFLTEPKSEREIDPDVLDRVCKIVSEQMCVPVNTLHPGTHFVRDLEMD